MSKLLKSLWHLLYPDLCVACRVQRPHLDEELCRVCLEKLPFIKSISDAKAALIGKDHFPNHVHTFAALFYYTKESYVAEMIHYIKYDGLYRIGRYLGAKLYTHHLSDLALDGYTIIPVPLHPKKLKKRGYNQAEMIAEGIAKACGLPILPNLLIRVSDTASQTKKNQSDRAKVLEAAFDINQKIKDPPKKIILVDDVITTGSTIAACVKSLLEVSPDEIIVTSIGVSI